MSNHDVDSRHRISELEKRLAALEAERSDLESQLAELKRLPEQRNQSSSHSTPRTDAPVSNNSPANTKIALIRRLFRGREDVYARRWESLKTSKSGYQPACSNEWASGLCDKRHTKCADCPNREFIPLTDSVLRRHVSGRERPGDDKSPEFTIGIYPMLPDETCWFLAADFDKASWHEDAEAFTETCRLHGVPAGLERSRSGNGGHVWMFFAEPVPASLARQLGAFLITETMKRRPEIGFDSYDRFFPNQDTLPSGGFGNLIALPFQGKSRRQSNTLFLDEHFVPYSDQWAFLSSLQPLSLAHLTSIIEKAQKHGDIIGVRMPLDDEHSDEPWSAPPSRKKGDIPIHGLTLSSVELVLGNQVYIEKEHLPPELRNRLIRLSAFQNPEFYKAQAMRLPTFGKPRIISCAEDYPKHIALPKGCLDEIIQMLQSLGVDVQIRNERTGGSAIDVKFVGDLSTEQNKASEQLLASDNGVLEAGTAFGKTVVAINTIAVRGVNTLVLVHRQQLLDQWIARL